MLSGRMKGGGMKPGKRRPRPRYPKNPTRRQHGIPLDDSSSSPLREYDLLSCTMRFLASALFGIFIDIAIVFLYGLAVLMGYHPGAGWLSGVLAVIPLLWGALGIFFYNEMLDLAGEIIERFFLFWR